MSSDVYCPKCHVGFHISDGYWDNHADEDEYEDRCPHCNATWKVSVQTELHFSVQLAPESEVGDG